MDNLAVLKVLKSFLIVILVVILYFLVPKPKPLFFRILFILFVSAAVLGILAGIIAPLIKK